MFVNNSVHFSIKDWVSLDISYPAFYVLLVVIALGFSFYIYTLIRAQNTKKLLDQEQLKLSQLVENRKKPTWCHACDVNRKYIGIDIGISRVSNVYRCPICDSKKTLQEF